MEFDPRTREPRSVYRLVTSAVVPRPIGWISSRSIDGDDNLAPYSYFNAVSSVPPVVMFSAGGTGEDRKDTPDNVLETEEFVWNLVTEDLAEAMDKTSAQLDGGESEFEFADLDRSESVAIDPPRVADAAISFECRLHDWLEVYDNTVVLGDVVHVHVDDALLTDGEIDAGLVDAVGRLGGPYYTSIDRMDLERQY